MRNFAQIAERLIKNARWWRVRTKVRGALEDAYKDGLNDAASEFAAASEEIEERMRALGERSDRPVPRLPAPRVQH